MTGLRRVATNLTPRTQTALARLTADGESTTDAINRAIRLAAALTDLTDGGVLTVLRADGTRERIHLI